MNPCKVSLEVLKYPRGHTVTVGRLIVGKWLNGRFKGDSAVKHELFATEDLAIRALEKALTRHKQQGRIVTDKWVGPELRYEVEDSDGFVAVHWLSNDGDRE